MPTSRMVAPSSKRPVAARSPLRLLWSKGSSSLRSSGNFYKYYRYSHEQSGLQLARDVGSPINDDNEACTLSESLAELEIVPRPEVRESTNIDDLSDASSDDEEFEELAMAYELVGIKVQ